MIDILLLCNVAFRRTGPWERGRLRGRNQHSTIYHWRRKEEKLALDLSRPALVRFRTHELDTDVCAAGGGGRRSQTTDVLIIKILLSIIFVNYHIIVLSSVVSVCPGFGCFLFCFASLRYILSLVCVCVCLPLC